VLKTFLRAAIFTVLVPATATVFIPLWLHRASPRWLPKLKRVPPGP
jgi:hypothetical protein